jgi:hypothetical protein
MGKHSVFSGLVLSVWVGFHVWEGATGPHAIRPGCDEDEFNHLVAWGAVITMRTRLNRTA